MRKLNIDVFRYNPLDPESKPHMQTFVLDETPSMTLFIALTQIRETIDPTLMFDFCCRAGICGSCGMVINGRPGLACSTQTKDLPDHIVVAASAVLQAVGRSFGGYRHLVPSGLGADRVMDPYG